MLTQKRCLSEVDEVKKALILAENSGYKSRLPAEEQMLKNMKSKIALLKAISWF